MIRIEQTDNQIIDMYMKCKKIELAKMLLQANKMLELYRPKEPQKANQ